MNTWFIRHLVYPTPALSNTCFIQHLVNLTHFMRSRCGRINEGSLHTYVCRANTYKLHIQGILIYPPRLVKATFWCINNMADYNYCDYYNGVHYSQGIVHSQ